MPTANPSAGCDICPADGGILQNKKPDGGCLAVGCREAPEGTSGFLSWLLLGKRQEVASIAQRAALWRAKPAWQKAKNPDIKKTPKQKTFASAVAIFDQKAQSPFSNSGTLFPSLVCATTDKSSVPIMKSTWIMESLTPISCSCSSVYLS